MGGWDLDAAPCHNPTQETEARNAQRAYQLSQDIARELRDGRPLLQSHLCDIQREYLRDLKNATDGQLRTCDVEVCSRGGAIVFFKPPPHHNVAPLLTDAIQYINTNLVANPGHAAAYALWRINFIHPWADGNGRTARSIAYVLWTVALQQQLPGTRALPELIAQRKYEYQDGLKAADLAWQNKQVIDVRLLETLLYELVQAQLETAET